MTDPQTLAQTLVDEKGPPAAWQHATRAAIDAHLHQDVATSKYWVAVQQHLWVIAPQPGASDLDVYRSARSLISEAGAQGAWRHAIQNATEADADMRTQAFWLRVADVTTALSKEYGTKHA